MIGIGEKMTSYEEAVARLMKYPLVFSKEYENFIFGYCEAMGVGSYGRNIIKTIEVARSDGSIFTGIDLVSIMYGVIIKMREYNDPAKEIFLSANIGTYLLAYLITDEPIRVLAIMLFNQMLIKKLSLQSLTIDEIKYDLIDTNSTTQVRELVDRLLSKIRNLPKGIGPGEDLSDRQALVAFGATYKTWEKLMELGQPGINQIIQIMNSGNDPQAVVASIILAVWTSPQHQQIESIYEIQPFIRFNSPGAKDLTTKIIGNLAMKTVALSGNPDAQTWIKDLCTQKKTTTRDWMVSVVRSSICYVRDL